MTPGVGEGIVPAAGAATPGTAGPAVPPVDPASVVAPGSAMAPIDPAATSAPGAVMAPLDPATATAPGAVEPAAVPPVQTIEDLLAEVQAAVAEMGINAVWTPDGNLPGSANTVPAVAAGYAPADGDKFYVSVTAAVLGQNFYSGSVIEWSSLVNGGEYVSASGGGGVLYDAVQALTLDQQKQAQENVDVLKSSAVIHAGGVQVLTETQLVEVRANMSIPSLAELNAKASAASVTTLSATVDGLVTFDPSNTTIAPTRGLPTFREGVNHASAIGSGADATLCAGAGNNGWAWVMASERTQIASDGTALNDRDTTGMFMVYNGASNLGYLGTRLGDDINYSMRFLRSNGNVTCLLPFDPNGQFVDNSITADMIAPTGVAAGTYENATVTVDTEGRVTAISQNSSADIRNASMPPTVTISASATLSAAHRNVWLRVDAAADITITLDDAIFQDGDVINVEQTSTGQVTLAAGAGVTMAVPSGSAALTAGQHSVVGVRWSSGSQVVLFGGLDLI